MYVLIYDLPKGKSYLRVRINRKLHGIRATKLQDSVWQASDVQSLIEIAELINTNEGKAIVIEGKRLV